jgi:DNA-binding transcriptional ArsR family regulator
MAGDADVAAVAALMGEPARAAVLCALADGRALAATTLASEADVARSTVSAHLARLVEGGLIRVEPSGRHRYFRLAGPEIETRSRRLRGSHPNSASDRSGRTPTPQPCATRAPATTTSPDASVWR